MLRAIPLLALSLVSCRMFWQQRWEFQEAVWDGDSSVVELHIGFREKSPIDPMSSTTDKKDFSARLARVNLARPGEFAAVSPAVPGQPMTGLQRTKDGFAFITILDGDPEKREVVFISKDLTEHQMIPALRGTIALLASPDGSRTAAISGTQPLQIRLAADLRSIVPAVELPAGSAVDYTWDDNAFYVRVDSKVFLLKDSLAAAAQFPACFHSSSSGAVSGGKRYVRMNLSAPGTVETAEVPKVPLISRVSEIGLSCP